MNIQNKVVTASPITLTTLCDAINANPTLTFLDKQMKKTPSIKLNEIAKQVSKIKISKKFDSIEEAPFFKKKIEKGAKTLAVAGLPQ